MSHSCIVLVAEVHLTSTFSAFCHISIKVAAMRLFNDYFLTRLPPFSLREVSVRALFGKQRLMRNGFG